MGMAAGSRSYPCTLSSVFSTIARTVSRKFALIVQHVLVTRTAGEGRRVMRNSNRFPPKGITCFRSHHRQTEAVLVELLDRVLERIRSVIISGGKNRSNATDESRMN